MPGLPDGTRRVFHPAIRRPRIEADVADEVAFHLGIRVAELVARGWSPEAARAEALRRFGDRHHWSVAMTAVDRERSELEQRAEWFDDLEQDLRFGVRSLLRAPVFTLLAVVTLALGIGANAAVFGVVKSVLLDALPYADADRLVRVYARFEASKLERSSISPGAAVDIAGRLKSFQRVAAFNFSQFDLAYVDEAGARVLTGASVAGDYFATLGVRPALGRALGPADGPTNHGMLSHAAWQREFGGDPGVLGRTIRIERQPIEIVGVLPRGYVGPMGEADLVFQMDLPSRARAPGGRDQHYLGVVG